MIARTAAFHADLVGLIGEAPGRAEGTHVPFPDSAALLIVNAQRFYLDGSGSSPVAGVVARIEDLVASFRSAGRPIYHVKHASPDPASPFAAGRVSSAFLDALSPAPGEGAFEKEKSSAFSASGLGASLEAGGIGTLVLAGLTANECIDATAREAKEAGYDVVVVGDATASFDLRGPDDALHPAERVHRLTLANLHHMGISIIDTEPVLARTRRADGGRASERPGARPRP